MTPCELMTSERPLVSHIVESKYRLSTREMFLVTKPNVYDETSGTSQPTLSCSLIYAMVILSSAQSFSCDADVSKPLCPGTVVTCTCLVTGTVSQTWWTFSALCYNKIPFRQVAPCSPASGTCGPYITATNLASSANAPDQPMIVNSSVGTHQLTVTWAPPAAGGVPTSYNVTIKTVVVLWVIADNGSPVYTHTFTGLVSDTLYTVSVVAINCAGHNKTLLVQQTSMELIPLNITPSLHLVPALTGLSESSHLVILTASIQAYKATMGTDKQKRNETVSAVESIELDSNVAYGTVL
eukprot:Em0006g120a